MPARSRDSGRLTSDTAYDAVMSATDASSDTVLTREELAATASVPETEVDRLVDAGVLVDRETPEGPFRKVDVLRIRMVRACEEGGIPAEAISAAIKEGRLSFAFTENWRLFEAASTLVPQTHAELAAEVGLSFEALRAIVTAFGFTPLPWSFDRLLAGRSVGFGCRSLGGVRFDVC
jgi:hypothetical protein